MKKIFYCLFFLMPFISCVSKSDADKLQNEKDSLAVIVAEKDSLINDVFASLNGIAENLNAIKSRENIITSSFDGGDMEKMSTVQINEDIEAIDQLLKNNRETIARLQRSADMLKKADIKVASLEKLIKELGLQVESKNSEITMLKNELKSRNVEIAELGVQVESLNTTVSDLAETKKDLEGEVKTKSDLLNTAYYIVGNQKELITKQIVYKSGFIGRTMKINESRSLDSFTQIDVRSFDEVIIGQKNVELVSSHPAGSYEFIMSDKTVFSSLVILDKTKFWEYSKVLVISYK